MSVRNILKSRLDYLQWELETYGKSKKVRQQLDKTKKLLEELK